MWHFNLSESSAIRLPYLSTPPTFQEIVESLATRCEVTCLHRDPCQDNHGFSRIVATLVLKHEDFDLLFNALNGLRYQYYVSPVGGKNADRYIIRKILPLLLESHVIDDGISLNEIKESLKAESAKVWVAESGNEPKLDCLTCAGEWSARDQAPKPEIINGRWERKKNGSASGASAPYLTKLRVIGGFLNNEGKEWVDERKMNRAREIHDTGWT